MSRFLRDLALAHERHEGFFRPGENPKYPKGSLSYRNNNSGNLRLSAYQRKAYGAVQGAGGFAKFPTYEIGLQALMDDIRAKITGHSAHINYAKNPTFLDYIKVYAPKDDGNNPAGYTQALIRSLPQYPLRPDMKLSNMAYLIRGSKLPLREIAAQRRQRRIAARLGENALQRWMTRLRSNMKHIYAILFPSK